MLESLKYYVNMPALFIVLGLVVGIGALGLWAVHRSTGRPIREMLTLLAGAFALITLMLVAIIALHGWMDSPDFNARRNVNVLMRWGMLPVAWLIWWVFNRLSKPKRGLRSRQKTPQNHEPIA